MKRTVYYPEIFEMIGKAKTKKAKIEILHRYKNVKGFYDILRLCYDPNINWLVTRKELENLQYDKMDIADYDLAPTTLFLEARRRLYNYTNLRQPPLKKRKIIQNITGMFSAMHEDEIELFKQIVDGRIKEKGLTEKLVRDAFPGLLSEPKNKPVKPRATVKSKATSKKTTSKKTKESVKSVQEPVQEPVQNSNIDFDNN
jgi:hypothetical protein